MKAIHCWQSKYMFRGSSGSNILEYNRVDCTTIYEIVQHLRKNHCS